jgi:hypothetical protein
MGQHRKELVLALIRLSQAALTLPQLFVCYAHARHIATDGVQACGLAVGSERQT